MGLPTLSEAARWRLKGLGLAAVVLAFSAVDAVFGVQDLLYLVRGFAEDRPIITSSQFAGTALALAPMGFSIGVMMLFARKATSEEQKKASENRSPWAYWILFLIVGSIPAALAAPIVQYVVVNYLATSRGYASCPTPDWPRKQPDRWARPGTPCPGEGADPNK